MSLRKEFNDFCKASDECAGCKYDGVDCHFKFAFDKGFDEAVKKIKDAIHEIYSGNLHCVEDYCKKDVEDNCEACFYKAITESIEKISNGRQI